MITKEYMGKVMFMMVIVLIAMLVVVPWVLLLTAPPPVREWHCTNDFEVVDQPRQFGAQSHYLAANGESYPFGDRSWPAAKYAQQNNKTLCYQIDDGALGGIVNARYE